MSVTYVLTTCRITILFAPVTTAALYPCYKSRNDQLFSKLGKYWLWNTAETTATVISVTTPKGKCTKHCSLNKRTKLIGNMAVFKGTDNVIEVTFLLLIDNKPVLSYIRLVLYRSLLRASHSRRSWRGPCYRNFGEKVCFKKSGLDRFSICTSSLSVTVTVCKGQRTKQTKRSTMSMPRACCHGTPILQSDSPVLSVLVQRRIYEVASFVLEFPCVLENIKATRGKKLTDSNTGPLPAGEAIPKGPFISCQYEPPLCTSS